MSNHRGQQRDKPFRDALRMEAFAGEIEVPVGKRSLRALARALLKKGIAGDVAAAREIADRLDGKVPQAIGGSEELGPLVHSITWLETSQQSPSTTGLEPNSSPSTTDPSDGPA